MRLRLWLVLALLTVAVSVGVFYTRPAGPWGRVTPAELGRLEEHRLLGIALLENHRFPEAAAEFAAIRKARPDLGLGYVNGAVALLANVGTPAKEAPALADRAAKLMPRSALPLLVQAKVSSASGNGSAAESALLEALRREPNNPLVLSAAFRHSGGLPGYPTGELITRLSALAPANLAVQLELLVSQSRERDWPGALQTVAKVRYVTSGGGAVYGPRLTKLEATLRSGRGDALQEALIVSNVLKTHPSFQPDRRAAFRGTDDTTDLALRQWDVPPPSLGEPPLPEVTVRWTELAGPQDSPGSASAGIVPLALGDISPNLGTGAGSAGQPAPSTPDRPMLDTPDLLAGGAQGALLHGQPGGFAGRLLPSREPMSLALADLNNDFGLDLYTVREQGDELWLNARSGVQSSPGNVTAASQESGFRRASLPHALRGKGTATAVDLDQDGDLDLLRTRTSGGPAVHYLRNNGNRTFTDLTRGSGLTMDGLGARQAVCADFDGDGDPDVFLVRPDAGCELFLNMRQDRFRRVTRAWGLPPESGAQCATIADPDRDGDWDVAVVGRGPHGSRLYRNLGDRFLAERATIPFQSEAIEWAEFVDFDNDTWVDLVCAGSDGVRLLRNDRGIWSDPVPALSGDCRWVTAIDLDQDHDFDLCVVDRSNRVRLVRNDGANGRPWLRLELEGYTTKDSPQAINSYAIGSEVELITPWDRQKVLVTRPETVLPLGRAGRAVAVRVSWTSGAMQNVVRPNTGDVVAAVQLVGVSCPFLYAWDGEGWRFHKDFNWRSPLGLLTARDQPIPHHLTTDWVSVPADVLRPVGSQYSLIATEELREISYFDEMRLVAIDHPAETETYLDERFPMGPADPFTVYSVTHPRLPRSARNGTGEDLLPALGRVDNVFTPVPAGGFRGVRPPHDLMLDLGDVPDPQNVRLFLTGWIYPTANSLNIASSQNPDLRVVPPTLRFGDGKGGWCRPDSTIGLPCGKRKTIVLDLSGRLTPGDHRVKLTTTFEIRWDRAFFASGESPAPLRQSELPLIAANLQPHGISRFYYEVPEGPDLRDYGRLLYGPGEDPRGPIPGLYTRLGDCAPLLRSIDDQYAIIGYEDELRLTFEGAGLPLLPNGWKRDFAFITDGWTKDSDRNTVSGETVEPLPFHGMKRYPYGSDEAAPDTPAHRDWRRKWNTRLRK